MGALVPPSKDRGSWVPQVSHHTGSLDKIPHDSKYGKIPCQHHRVSFLLELAFGFAIFDLEVHWLELGASQSVSRQKMRGGRETDIEIGERH